MKFFLTSFFILLIFTGCEKTNLQAPLKTYHDFNNFDYSKEAITFYEQEFENILTIDNAQILKEYYKFYDKNSSYFVNGKQKASKLLNKYLNLRANKNENSTKDIKELHELAKKDNIKALRALVEYYKIESPKKSLEYLEKLVSLKDIKSMKDYASANIYINRPILTQDIKTAIKTYEELGKLGELSAIMRLGNIYEYGYHKSIAEKDLDKALEYYEDAASKGYTPALKKLHKIYSCEKCDGDRYNIKKAKEIEHTLSKAQPVYKKRKINKPKLIAKPIKKEIKQKAIVKEEPKRAINIASITKNKDKKPIATIKCYDMKIALANVTKECKDKLNSIKEIENPTSISIIPVLDKNDKEKLTKVDPELLYKGLSYNRAEEIIWYLRDILKDDSIINTTTYHVTSKKSNRGVVIKLFK